MTRIVICGGPSTDIAGDFAIKVLEIAYAKSQLEDQPQRERDDIREAICLARGWRFER
jgi:hypothetical protein